MNRKTVFTHPDGAVSTRSSKTRFYEWAVEAKTNQHLVAADRLKEAEKVKAEAAAFAEAVAGGQYVKKTEQRSQRGSYTNFYVKHPETGEDFWLGAESRDADGNLHTWEKEGFDRTKALTKNVEQYTARIERLNKEAAALLAGPETTYAIARWSERRDSAEKAVGTFQWPHTTYRVVKAEEAPAKASKRK
jgi:hypothetical protein